MNNINKLTKLLTKFVRHDGATTTPTYHWMWQIKLLKKKEQFVFLNKKKIGKKNAFPTMLCKATTTSFNDFGPSQPGIILRTSCSGDRHSSY